MKKIYIGNSLQVIDKIDENSVDCIVTSPPYYRLRKYSSNCETWWGGDAYCIHEKNSKSDCIKCGAWYGELGQENELKYYIKNLSDIFDKCRKILKDDGNLFIDIGDCYSRENKKQLNMVPYRLAIEMQDRGWIIREIIIWAKKCYLFSEGRQVGNGLPEGGDDRFLKTFEVIIHAVKSTNYYFKILKTNISDLTVDRIKYGHGINKNKYENNFYKGLNNTKYSLYEKDNYIQKKFFEYNETDNNNDNIDDNNIDDNNFDEIKYIGNTKYKEQGRVNSIHGRFARKMLDKDKLALAKRGVVEINRYIKNKFKESGLSKEFFLEKTGVSKYLLDRILNDISFSTYFVPSKELWDLFSEYLHLGNYDDYVKKEYRDNFWQIKPFAKLGNVWLINTQAANISHFAPMPKNLVKILIECGCKENGVVMDPFAGAGTVMLEAESKNLGWIGIEINEEYLEIIKQRFEKNKYETNFDLVK